MRDSPIRRDRLPLPLAAIDALFIICVVLLMGLPMINVLAVSFSTKAASETPGLVLLPIPPTVQGYVFIWDYIDLWRPFFNTVFVSLAGTVAHVILSAMAGYVLMQKDMPFRKVMTSLVLFTMTIPSELTLVSIYAVNKQYHLINSYTGLIVNGMVSGFSVLLMRNYFISVPKSLAEAARIDRCSEFKIFRKIYLRLSKPGIMTIGTLELIRRWNNISTTVTLVSDMKKTTLPVMLRWLLFDQTSTSGTEYIFANAKMAAVVISAVPLVLLYFFAQRFFVTGALLGSVKG
ncbi:MAG: carbohydrate ABC transporter permease [Rectinema sp.]